MRNIVVHTHTLRIQRDDLVILQFFAEPVDQVDFRADRPLCPLGRSHNLPNDAFRGTDYIGGLRYFKLAFRVDDYLDPGVFARSRSICSG